MGKITNERHHQLLENITDELCEIAELQSDIENRVDKNRTEMIV